MRDQLIIKGIVFMSALSFVAILVLFYFNYKYDSNCGNTIKMLFDNNQETE